jgi:hypothetical protein
MDALQKPFSRKEYLQLFDMASIRTPLVKLRQVRKDAKFYSTDEMGNSYFDHYPGMFLTFYIMCIHYLTSIVLFVSICFLLPFALSPFRNLILIVIVTGQVNYAIYLLHFMNSLTTF